MNSDALKLENQLCFPLYACSREIVKKYTPFLESIGLTYTQYLVMLVLWEEGKTTAKEIGHKLHLDSGTLTPLLKRLEAGGFITRARSEADERRLDVSLTAKGKQARDKAACIPQKIGACVNLTGEEAAVLYKLLYRLLECM